MPGYGGGIGGDGAPGNEAGAGGGSGAGGGFGGGEGGGEGGGGERGTPTRSPMDNPMRSPTEVNLERSVRESLGLDDDDEFDFTIAFDRRTGRPELAVLAYGATRAKLNERIQSQITDPVLSMINRALSKPVGAFGLIANALADYFGQAFSAIDGRALGNAPKGEQTGGEVAVNRMEEEAAKKRKDDGKTDEEKATESRERLRADMEELIGGFMPDEGFDLPDWSVPISLEAPLDESAPEDAGDQGERTYEQMLGDIYARIFGEAA